MADYIDLRGLFNDGDLLGRVEVAVSKAATDFLITGTLDQQKWAWSTMLSLKSQSKIALIAVLAQNSGLTIGQITGAGDPAVQTNIDAIVDGLVIAFNNGV